MSKLELLSEIINQMSTEIIRYSLTPDQIIDRLKHGRYYLECLNMICETNFKELVFYSYCPEMDHLNNSVSLNDANEVFKNQINQIYQNEQIQEQLN